MLPAKTNLQGFEFKPYFNANFEGNGKLDSDQFVHDTMMDAFNRAGNDSLDEQGNGSPWTVPGKRWSAWYNKYMDEMSYRENGYLVQTCKVIKEIDPTRINFKHQGREQNYRDNRFYAPWLATWARKKFGKEWQGDPNSPGYLFEPGMQIDIVVNFSKLRVPGARSSVWLMPAETMDGEYAGDDAYTETADTGVEIDIFEYDVAKPHNLQCKVLAGPIVGNTPGGNINLMENHNIDLSVGWHTISLVWLKNSLQWWVDGIRVNIDRDRVPKVKQYLIISREMNSGVKGEGEGENGRYFEAIPPYIPYDPGLFPPASVIDSIDLIDDDMVVFKSIRAFRLVEEKATEQEPIVEDSDPEVDEEDSTVIVDLDRELDESRERGKGKGKNKEKPRKAAECRQGTYCSCCGQKITRE